MIVVADARVLVAELLRQRGRALLAHPDLRIVVAEDQWDETQHELGRRLEAHRRPVRITAAQAQALNDAITTLVNDRVIEVIPPTLHEHNEIIARRHVPRDPRTGRR